MKRKSATEVQPKALEGMLGLEHYIRSSGLEPKIRELIKVRSSVLNGCAYCMDMHTEEALELGESNRRLFAVATWHESPLFSKEERIALQLTDEITHIGDGGVQDETYDAAIAAFGEEKTAQIIMQAIIINMWNRLAISGKQEFKSKHDK